MREQAECVQKHDIGIDAIRGVAAFLVIVGHCIQTIYAPNSFDNVKLFEIIYSFHMPLFMALSGYLTYGPEQRRGKRWLFQRIISLSVVLCFWFVTDTLVLKGRFWEKPSPFLFVLSCIKNVLIKPANGSLWFVAVLLENTIIFWSAVRLAKHLKLNEKLVVLMLWLVIVLQPCEWFGLAYVARQLPYFALGYFTHQYQQTKSILSTHLTVGGIVLSGILFVPLAWMWNRTTYPDCFLFVLPIGIMNALNEIYTFVVAVFGICFVSGVVYYWFPNGVKRLFSALGRYSLESYCLQGFFYYIVTGFSPLQNTLIEIAIISVLVVVIPWLLEKNQLLAFMLFGRQPRCFVKQRNEECI